MRKLRLFLDFNREEEWLNREAGEGHLLSRVDTPVYWFREVDPGTAVVRIDYQPSMSESDYNDYVSLFADSGWQLLSGPRKQRSSHKAGPEYFVSFDKDSSADIFSDTSSRAERYKRSATRLYTLGGLLLILSVAILSAGGDLFSPQEWYRTPGLWDLSGLDFLGRFLFETLFVVVPRVGAQLLLLASTAACLLGAVYQWVLYRRAIS